MNSEKLAIGSAFGASLIVASCCLAPALAIVLGVSVGGLSWLSAFAPYRPIFMGVGALSLSYAAWRIYKKPADGISPACQDDGCAPDSRQRTMTRTMFWVGVAAFMLSVVYPYALGAYLANGG